ncbi:MAG: 5-(carboxyamino)imidazole ribonucleotide synthase [Gammaproteobacteria bacterium]|jgi:5-(carboxyamino)imidazole ribonucleotide synthase
MAVLPGSTVGMLGGGQLGRMFVSAARTMGYEVIVLDPDPASPAGSLANRHIQAAYDDTNALDDLAENCQVVTTEFENIPAQTLDYLAHKVAVHPSADALTIAQNRQLEKAFFNDLGLKTVDWISIENSDQLKAAENFSFPAILKTATLGYDGKGQVVCLSFSDLVDAYTALGDRHCVIEQRINLAREVSVILCRSQSGQITCFPVAENEHKNGILDTTIAPARITQDQAYQLQSSARKIANGLNYCGVLAVEFFISNDSEILVNEMAPRPHNSGHYTLDGCDTSQFEQQLRMVCGLPAGSCRQHSAVVMWNILGDIWPDDSEPVWDQLLGMEKAKLHLYGKKEARVGRKMGHINCIDENLDRALSRLNQVKRLLP